MRKGLISILLAVIMVINLAPLALATGEITSFTYDSLTAEVLTNHELTDFVTKDLVLPGELSDGTKITWSSDNEGAITSAGKVTRAKKEEATATLTATIPGVTAKTFTFTVAPQTTNVIYQDNFAYSIPESTQAISVVPGWDWFQKNDTSGNNKVLYDSTDKLYYLWFNNNPVNSTWYKNTTEVTATNFVVMFDFKYDTTKATSKIMDIKADFTSSSGAIKGQVTLVRINNGAIAGGYGIIPTNKGFSLPATGWIRMYLELDTEKLCGRLQIGDYSDDGWSNWAAISGLTSDYAYSPVKNFYFRPGSGGSASGELLFDNFLIAEYIDPAVFDSIEYINGTLNSINASMFTSENTNALTQNLNLNPQELIDLNTANGTTVSFTSSDPEVLEISGNTGIVTPGAGDKTVTLTVTVSHNGASKSKTFTYTVLASEDYVAVKDTYDKLDLSYITSQEKDKITDNLNLNSSELQALNTLNGTTVTFTSDNTDAIEISGTTGIVKRGEERKTVTLTATISCGIQLLSKEFPLTVLPSGDAAEAEEVANAIDFDLFTTQSKYAVTKNLNLAPSVLTELAAYYGATVTFKSNNNALKIEGTTGVVNRQLTEETVTLTAEVKKGAATKTKDITIVVPSQTTYVYDSNGFGYSEYLDMNAGNLPHWTSDTTGAATAWISKIRKTGNSYYMESVREESFGNRSNGTIFDFDQARKTQKLTLEMTLTYNDADADGSILYDFEFYGRDSEGNLINTQAKEMAYMRIRKDGDINIEDRTKSGKGGSAKRADAGGSNRIRFEFDYENDTLDAYIDGTRVVTDCPFYGPLGDGNDDYSSLSNLYISSFRTSVGANLQIDDFVVKCENPVYNNSLIEDASPRPLSVSSTISGAPTFTISSKYNEEYNIEQTVQLVNYGKELTKNVIFDLPDAFLVGNGNRESMIAIASPDNVAPFIINGLYIGANHGAKGRKITATAHGKTSVDIGSVWVDEAGKRYDLLRIVDNNTLLFLGHSTDPTQYNKFNAEVTGNLLYDSSFEGNCGVNTDKITVSGNSMEQVYPSISNRVHKIYAVRDGIKEEVADFTSQALSFNCDSIIFEDTYYIMNPCKIGETLRAQRPEGGYTSNTPDVAIGEPILEYKGTLTFEADGTVHQAFDHTVLKDLSSITYYGYQYYPRSPVFGGDVFRVVPGSKEFSAPKLGESVNTTFDFSLPFNATLSGSDKNQKLASAATIFPNGHNLGSSGWANSEKAPDRMLEYHSDSERELVSVFATGFFPIGDAAPEVRHNNTNYAVYFYQSGKGYPYFINSSSKYCKEGDKIQGIAYRKYYDLTKRDTTCEMYTVNKDEDIYFYIDYFKNGTDTINLADEYIISDIEVVQESDNIDYTISGNTVTINGKARDYLVLKAKRRGLEIVASVYDDTISELQVNAHNIDSSAVSGKLVAAGYDVNDKMTFFKSGDDVSIDKNNYEFAKVSGVNLNGAVKVKFFILDGLTTLKPIAHTNILTIE